MSKKIQFIFTGVYLFLIFVAFPLYVEDHYWMMGSCKWKFYLSTTVVYLAVMLVSALAGKVRSAGEAYSPSVCDWCALFYGICVILGLLAAEDRLAVWTGEDGWFMGAAAQLLFLASYFVISRSRIPVRFLVGCCALGSGVCFLLGILQRLGWDVLHMYEGLPDILLSDYISTIGNRTWMSGYVCVVFPLGVYLFWRAQERRQRIFWGLYTALAFAGLAATYSDSAYVGLGAVFFALGILSIGSWRRMFSFWQLLCIWFGQALLMCGLRALCGSRVRDPRGLTCYVYNWKWMLGGLAACGAVTVWIGYMNHRRAGSHLKAGKADSAQTSGMRGKSCLWDAGCGAGIGDAEDVMAVRHRRRLQWGCVAAAGIGGVLVVLLIVLNTKGVLEDVFGFTIHNRYLYFDDNWGDMRGWTWKMTCRMFAGLPLSRQLFGVGADGFANYGYGIPEYEEAFRVVWKNNILTNAHNEWLNMFFCQGIVGGLLYLGIFVGAAVGCFRYVYVVSGGSGMAEYVAAPGDPGAGEGAVDPGQVDTAEYAVHTEQTGQMLAPGIGLCILAYMCHNFFCYQQICATGPMFVLLGAAGAIARGRENNGKQNNRTGG